LRKIRVRGWKFRRAGEFAHHFDICRRPDCTSCEEGYSHAECDRKIRAAWLDLPAFSKSRPPHRACPKCSAILAERERVRNLPWRERAALKG
jgi:hypothetical protein